MAQTFKETAHLKINLEKYGENYEHIFGNKKEEEKELEEDCPKEVIHDANPSN